MVNGTQADCFMLECLKTEWQNLCIDTTIADGIATKSKAQISDIVAISLISERFLIMEYSFNPLTCLAVSVQAC